MNTREKYAQILEDEEHQKKIETELKHKVNSQKFVPMLMSTDIIIATDSVKKK